LNKLSDNGIRSIQRITGKLDLRPKRVDINLGMIKAVTKCDLHLILRRDDEGWDNVRIRLPQKIFSLKLWIYEAGIVNFKPESKRDHILPADILGYFELCSEVTINCRKLNNKWLNLLQKCTRIKLLYSSITEGALEGEEGPSAASSITSDDNVILNTKCWNSITIGDTEYYLKARIRGIPRILMTRVRLGYLTELNLKKVNIDCALDLSASMSTLKRLTLSSCCIKALITKESPGVLEKLELRGTVLRNNDENTIFNRTVELLISSPKLKRLELVKFPYRSIRSV